MLILVNVMRNGRLFDGWLTGCGLPMHMRW